MGDRGNIVIRQGTDSMDDVWFYTHWTGSRIKDVVKEALTRGQERWDDSPYLARIVFSSLVRGNEEELTGFGISTRICDNGHDIIVVDTVQQKVFTVRENELVDWRLPENLPREGKSFEAFCGKEAAEN